MLFPEAHDVRHTVEQALSLVYRNDLYLIRHSVHERSLTFRLGFYLQQLFPDWDVDCEYNKNCKTLWHNKISLTQMPRQTMVGLRALQGGNEKPMHRFPGRHRPQARHEAQSSGDRGEKERCQECKGGRHRQDQGLS